jgi:F-type H+-transporting ATPase subunit gamma
MANTKIIKQKIKAITSIKKITKTMEMVSVAKMKKSVSEVSTLTEYMDELKHIRDHIATESSEKSIYSDNTTLKNNKEIIAIFASNKGLCGSFNTNVYRQTKKIVDENPNIKYAICFGKFAEKIARKLGLEIMLSVLDIEKITSLSQVSKYEKFMRAGYIEDKWKNVHAVYTTFRKMGVFEPTNSKLYPMDPAKEEDHKGQAHKLYTFEPTTTEILDVTIPKITKTLIYSYILESRASENSARSFAMKRANESAGELLGALKIKFNKVRQDGITQEIAEISAGANA